MGTLKYVGSVEDFIREYKTRISAGDTIEVSVVGKEPEETAGGTPTPVPMPEGIAPPHEAKPGSIDKRLLKDMPMKTEETIYGHGTIKAPAPSPLFRNKIRQILKDNKVGRRVADKLFGRLDFKRLHKVETSPRLFTRKEAISKKQYNILLLVDCSGSMSGRKIHVACGSTIALIRDLQDITPLKVVGFNGIYMPIKDFDEKIPVEKIADTVVRKFVSHMHTTGGINHDHIAVRMATRDLMKQEGQKILLVLSDGQPACSGGGPECDEHCCNNLYDALIHERTKAERSGITVLSIGILTEAVKEFYTHYRILHDVDKLHDTVIEYMDKYIKAVAVRV